MIWKNSTQFGRRGTLFEWHKTVEFTFSFDFVSADSLPDVQTYEQGLHEDLNLETQWI